MSLNSARSPQRSQRAQNDEPEKINNGEFRRLLIERQAALSHTAENERRELGDQVELQRGEIGDIGDSSVMDTSVDYWMNLADHHRNELLEIQAALDRLNRGVFGECQSCENEISAERLRKIPFARFCFDCQSQRETRNGSPRPHSL